MSTMTAFIMTISMMCQNDKLAPPALPGDPAVVATRYLPTDAEKSCLKKLYTVCNSLVESKSKTDLRDCLAENI